MSITTSGIAAYLASKQNSWSPATLRSERYRLMALAPLLNGEAQALWAALQEKAPYTRVTTWTSVVRYWSAAFPKDPNPYELFRTENGNFFKNCYERKKVSLSYDEAKARIETIEDEAVKAHALSILGSAQRWCESVQPHGRGVVTGKGGKLRADLRGEGSGFGASYSTFCRKLGAAGLRPHDLRKLALSRAAERGAQAADLCEIAGWCSIATAIVYLQPKRTEALKGLLAV